MLSDVFFNIKLPRIVDDSKISQMTPVFLENALVLDFFAEPSFDHVIGPIDRVSLDSANLIYVLLDVLLVDLARSVASSPDGGDRSGLAAGMV